ncbi:class I SAM-dependent methyltransferase [Polymorphobacter fuscus]|uniref:Methyltransferase n=1 Tax=Sandarakinorhabdus fusca TaxID=1439888 RepID=A0A7C9KXA9_9SPHN|nr:class I SAM-dependent methyltransferase [Polymorphobacter fuscus]KAB7646463.1 class I SAM-dependent methyltransferase [Polymorphobacter fuscus]MQT17705.1 methyltransferase [Polymorphobacter fuscus]NJC09748.1 putative methyltransferase [Polymorphobacter fuscus]
MSANRVFAMLSLAGAAIAAPAVAAPFDAAIAGAHRTAEAKARDVYRHPAETLGFFGIVPTMTVVEISPAGGWYTDVLAPALAGKGQYIAAHNNPAASAGAAAGVQRFKDKLAAAPAVYGNAKVTAFGKDSYDIAPAGSADAVLTFRNVHNWQMAGFAPDAFKAFYKALKPGGVLGIVEHRLPEDKSDDLMKTSGYMKTSYVRKLAEDAGFKYVGASEVNANAKDTKDYPKGVWTLPPNYAEGDTDKAKYAAIGESDRMTLKFVKPR